MHNCTHIYLGPVQSHCPYIILVPVCEDLLSLCVDLLYLCEDLLYLHHSGASCEEGTIILISVILTQPQSRMALCTRDGDTVQIKRFLHWVLKLAATQEHCFNGKDREEEESMRSSSTCALQHRDIIWQVQSARAGFG